MIIAVDFDGTIVEHAYPRIGKPIPFALDVLKRLQQEDHHQLILWSVREGDLLQEAIDYCAAGGLEFYAANKNYPEEPEPLPRKLNADLFIDDRNLGGLRDWGVTYQMIKSGRPFSPARTLTSGGDGSQRLPSRKKNFFIRLGEAWDKAQGR